MSSIWTGVSGLLTYGQAIATTGNNLANTSTIGYKSSRTLFSDMLSSLAGSTSDDSQIGTGVQVNSMSMNTSSGALQSTNNSSEMAVTGDHGYFVVNNQSNGRTYYTRAGNFNYDKNGYLVTPTGCNVQGWAVDQTAEAKAKSEGTPLSEVPTTGGLTNIKIDTSPIAGQATASVALATNLDSDSTVGSKDATDPYFTMFKSYDAAANPPISNSSYSTTVKTYDSEGSAHTLTTYYSKVADTNGKESWEYTVAMDPAEDGNTTTKGTSKAGALMIGTLTFGSDGSLENQTAYTLTGSDPTSLSSWTQAQLDTSGKPEFAATFLSSSTSKTLSPQTMSFATGISTTAGAWSANAATTAAGIGTQASATAGFDTATTKLASSSTTNYATSSSTTNKSQDGYGVGSLTGTSVDANGVVSATYSNGQTKDLYVVALADFKNPSLLDREGDNLLSTNSDSGSAVVGRPKSGTLDGVADKTIEASNVQMATEMVNLIVDQRAFQANSKVITTSDEMMQKAMEIKK